MNVLYAILSESWRLLVDASVYMLFGMLMGGMLKVFLNPAAVSKHLGQGRFSSVFKAAFLGVPVPLCSCGVLPAAASLKRQGANKGAVTAFLISTPESGVDSIATSYALLDPIMTVARPVAAFVTAACAGILENLIESPKHTVADKPDLTCPVDGCCSGVECPPEEHNRHHSFPEKIAAGIGFAFGDLWNDLAGWFLVGILLAGIIGALIPIDVLTHYLGGGLPAMLLMLAMGIPIYICATASTPIAAALILKGVSPGAALVFLLAGPATNVTSLTVLMGVLGKRATAIYLITLSVLAVACGLAVDQVYLSFGLSAQAVVGKAAEIVPEWARTLGAVVLLGLSVKPVFRKLKNLLTHGGHGCQHSDHPGVHSEDLDACVEGREGGSICASGPT
ncbi:MAG: SO_0444 family Cu/Zn efflux transporter [Deltaproteobacteria bacterium]|nr:SO_0444 family Cu/Zn efflux transporter [Deltaproteobacteria bacterium]